MGITSLQVCMDASEWLQGTMNATTNDDCGGGSGGMDSSSSPTLSAGDFHHQHNNNNNLFASRPAATAHMMDRRLRPPLDQILKCPRCDSTHTKFCYYNNYSLSQPRYFCKTCRRYWTKGGTLRNIPVGGGCRKNKKSSPSTSSSKKSSTTSNGNNNSIDGYNNTDISPGSLINQNNLIMGSSSSSSCGQHTELQLAFPGSGMQFSPLISSFIGGATGNHTNFLESKYNALLENIHYGGGGSGGGGNYNNSCRPIDFMDHQQQKFDALVMGRNLHDQADNHHHHHHHHRLMGNSLGSDNGVDFSILGGGGGGEMGFTSDHHHQIQLQHHLTTTTTTPSTPTTNFINSHQQYTNTLNMMMMMDNRLMLPYHHDDVVEEDTTTTTVSAAGVLLHDDVKPSLNKILTLECQDHQQHGTMMSTSTMPGGGGVTLGSSSWTNMMNGYGQSTPTNQLI